MRARAEKVSVPSSTVTSGFATMLWYQSGFVAAPPLEANTGDGVIGEALVGDRVDPLSARLRAAMMQQEERSTLEVAAYSPAIGAELVDDLLIPVGHPSGLLLRWGLDAVDNEVAFGEVPAPVEWSSRGGH